MKSVRRRFHVRRHSEAQSGVDMQPHCEGSSCGHGRIQPCCTYDPALHLGTWFFEIVTNFWSSSETNLTSCSWIPGQFGDLKAMQNIWYFYNIKWTQDGFSLLGTVLWFASLGPLSAGSALAIFVTAVTSQFFKI